MTLARKSRVERARSYPTVGGGIISPPGVEILTVVVPTPDDHFTAGPHRGVNDSGLGGIGRRSRCPAIRAGVVSRAGA